MMKSRILITSFNSRPFPWYTSVLLHIKTFRSHVFDASVQSKYERTKEVWLMLIKVLFFWVDIPWITNCKKLVMCATQLIENHWVKLLMESNTSQLMPFGLTRHENEVLIALECTRGKWDAFISRADARWFTLASTLTGFNNITKDHENTAVLLEPKTGSKGEFCVYSHVNILC